MTSAEYRKLRNLLVAVAAALALTVGLIFVDGRDQTSRIVEQRTEARHRECVRDNIRSRVAVEEARRGAEVLVATARANKRSAGPEADQAYIDAQVDAAEKLHPTRSCTDTAIEDYYQSEEARQ